MGGITRDTTCPFLGKARPDTPFPVLNRAEDRERVRAVRL